MYTPFVYALNLIAPAHTFGVHVLGTTPGLPGASTLPHHAADTDAAEHEDKDLMLAGTDSEAFEAELRAEALLDAANACAAVARAPGWKAGWDGPSFAEGAETARRRCGSGSGNRRGWCARYAVMEAEEGRVWRQEGTCRCWWVRLRNRMDSG